MSACTSPRPVEREGAGAGPCSACHGSADNPAPPPAAGGATETSALGVGAHQTHLRDGPLRRALECQECHVVPQAIDDPGHIDEDRADVTFGPLARASGASPAWNRDRATCAGVYCHGATLTGGSNGTPVWTKVDGTQASCGSCHGAPPPAPHPQDPQCSRCHPDTVDPNGQILIAGGFHINGVVDVGTQVCTSCHGDPSRTAAPAAPPRGTKGETETTARAVGAHQAHLTGGPLRAAVPCGECHPVPSNPAHASGKVEVVFGPLASSAGAKPVWDLGAGTCQSYCHGMTLSAGGTLTRPSWTKVDGTQAACGTCHGAPPPAPHPASSACSTCHKGTVDANGQVLVANGLHINGSVEVDVNGGCTTCHGDASRTVNGAAPPVGVKGESATTTRAVGAHQAHLVAGRLRGPVDCNQCHVVPTSLTHATGTVDLTFGALARQGGASPVWNGSTCAGSYCHGNFRNGNTGNAPLWTGGPAQAACGTCHGTPPTGVHPQRTDCGSCHQGYSAASVNLALHMNGSVDVTALTCTTCHGDPSRSVNAAAPPVGTRGETANTTRAVGAHLAHLADSSLRRALSCSECHVVPTTQAHANGSVAVTFGPLAGSGGVKPSWNGTSCGSTYCHGNFKNGNTANAPVWTQAGSAACGSCHGLPPGGTHPQSTACQGCHAGYTQSSVDPAHHIDGIIDVTALTCTSCHGTAGRAAGAAAPPAGTHGETATATRAVGAHQRHLAATLSAPVACGECHPVPTSSTHSNGKVEVAFGALARSGGAAPVWNGSTCAGAWCHGSTLASPGAATAPVWTRVDGSQRQCGSCHAASPGSGAHGKHRSRTCGTCHGTGYSSTSVAVATHVNGKLDVVSTIGWNASTRSCSNSCHGTERWSGGG